MHRLHGLTSLVTNPTPAHLAMAVLLLVMCAAAVWLLAHVPVSSVFVLGIVAEAFSGNWKYVPIPVPLDRVIFLLGVGLLIVRGTSELSQRRILLRPIHFLLLAVACYGAISAAWAGSLTSSYGFYALLDRLGLIPFLMFTLAPLLFGTKRERNALLIAMVALGVYLGVTAIFEGVGLHALVFPRYISNEAIGITQSRARGPYLASDALGLMLFNCAVFSAIALTEWRSRRAKLLCWAVIAMALLGIFLTLTRSVWIGAVLATVVVSALQPRLRKRLPAIGAAVAVVVVGALLTVPGLASNANGRVNTESSVWDRYNTNHAALRIIEAHPLFGVGWQEFQTVSWMYLREAGTYPLTGSDIEVHNVFLSHFAELGLLGGLLWIGALVLGIGGALLRRSSPELLPWRLGLLAIFIMFVVVADLGPLSYAQPNLILWLMAGIVACERNSIPRWSSGAVKDGGSMPEPELLPDLVLSGAPSMTSMRKTSPIAASARRARIQPKRTLS